MTTTNALNNECWNDFTVGNGPDGGLRRLRVQNENNTAGSMAAVQVIADDTAAGDPFVTTIVGTTHSYAAGIDNSSGGHWRLTYENAATATPSSALQIIDSDTSGRLLYPNQPMLKAYLSAPVANVTGDNTIYTIPFDTVEFDRDGNYNPVTGLFTVPVAGVYHVEAMVTYYGLVAGYSLGTSILYKNAHEICLPRYNPLGTMYDHLGINQNYFQMSILESAAVGDTFSVAFAIANTVAGGKVISVEGVDSQTYFCVWLVG